jgi:hypothetical protein
MGWKWCCDENIEKPRDQCDGEASIKVTKTNSVAVLVISWLKLEGGRAVLGW